MLVLRYLLDARLERWAVRRVGLDFRGKSGLEVGRPNYFLGLSQLHYEELVL